MKKLKFSVNPELINKFPPKDKRYMAEGFIDIEDTLESLAQSIQEGWAFSYQFLDGRRSKDNFIATDIVAIDVDNGSVISEALKNPVVSSYCSLLYTTSGHTPDHHRYRLVFVLPRTITDASELRAVNVSLCQRLHGDIAATDPARMFYGNNESYPQLLGNEISEAFLEELILDGKRPLVSDSVMSAKPVQTRSGLYLDDDQEFKTSDGSLVKFSEFDQKTTVFCPFHHDENASAFLSFNPTKHRFMRCSTCSKTYWMGKEPEPFDFDEFEHTVKKYKENPPDKNELASNTLSALFGDDLISKVKLDVSNITFTKQKHIDLDEIKQGLTFIKSPKGSGKTTFLKRALEKIIYHLGTASLDILEENDDPESPSPLYTNKRVLLIGHRQALIREMCQRLNLNCYLDYKESERTRHQRFGVCLDSLSMALDNGKENTKYDLIIIDESEQVLSHFLSETIGSNRIHLFEQFQSLLANAKSVIALDADLGWITFNTITRLAKKNAEKPTPIHIYINQWKTDQKPIYVYRRASQLIDHIRSNIIAGKRVFISSNSKSKILALEKSIEELSNTLNRHISLITVTSENSKTADVQKFITNIKSEIINYQVVLSSPSLGTGIDITFDNDDDLIDYVYGLYENRINTHTEIDQQLGRVRHPKEVHVWVSPQRFNFETEFEVIREEYLRNNFLVKLFNERELAGEVGQIASEGIGNFLMMATLITCYQRASKNNLRSNFLLYKAQQGWQLSYVTDDDVLTKQGNVFLKVGKEILNEITIDQVLNAKPLERYQFEDVEDRMDSNDDGITRDEFHSYIRTKIELFYREKITKKLVELDNKGTWRRGIKTFESVTNKELIKYMAVSKLETKLSPKEFDLTERIIPNIYSKCLLLHQLFSQTPLFKKGSFDSSVEFTFDDLNDFSKLAIKMKPYIENHLEINIRKDIIDKPIQQLGQMLKLVGLEHWRTKTSVVNGIKFYTYCLSRHRLTEVKRYVIRRKKLEDKWEVFNKFHKFERKPELEALLWEKRQGR